MAKLVTFALCDYYMQFLSLTHKSILTLCCVSQEETDFRLHLTVSLPSVFPGLDLSKGVINQGIEVMW